MSNVFGERDVWIEHWDENDQRIDVLAKLNSRKAAFAAFDQYVRDRPDDRIIVKHRALVMRKSWED